MGESDQTKHDYLLERYLLNELSPTEHDCCERRLADEPALRERLQSLRQSTAEILTRYPKQLIAREVAERARRPQLVPPREKPRRAVWVMAPLGACAVIVLAVALHAPTGGELVATDAGVRQKGDAQLSVFRREGTSRRQLRSGDRAHAGDVLQVAYVAPVDSYVAIVSVDGRGAVTVHYPDSPTSARVTTGGQKVVAHAYELDDAPSFERFVLVECQHPFDVRLATTAARALASGIQGGAKGTAPVSQNKGCIERTVSLTKE